MKQVLIRRKGVGLFEVPEPTCGPGEVKIQVHHSAISAGTEVKAVSSQQTLTQKLADPQMIKAGLDMLRREGIQATLATALGWNQGSAAIGYSVAGTVLEVGREVKSFARGERVAAAGAVVWPGADESADAGGLPGVADAGVPGAAAGLAVAAASAPPGAGAAAAAGGAAGAGASAPAGAAGPAWLDGLLLASWSGFTGRVPSIMMAS